MELTYEIIGALISVWDSAIYIWEFLYSALPFLWAKVEPFFEEVEMM